MAREDIPRLTFSQEQYDYLAQLFPYVPVEPGQTADTIFYNAGQQSLLRVIENRIGFSPRKNFRDS